MNERSVSTNWGEQGFRSTMATSAGAGLYLFPLTGVTGRPTIELWDKLPGAVGANTLAGGTTAWGEIPAYYTLYLAYPVAVRIGQPYSVAFNSAAKYTVPADYDTLVVCQVGEHVGGNTQAT